MPSPRLNSEARSQVCAALNALQSWVEKRAYAGFDPYDWLNSPVLRHIWRCNGAMSSLVIQAGRHFGGTRARQMLRVPSSMNPKAVGLFISGYCDRARAGEECSEQLSSLKNHLKALRAPHETDYCWGYDWNFVSLRGGILPAFAANSIATVFCAEALLDLHEVYGDEEALDMALSACRFCATRLNRPIDDSDQLCFSYTPENRTLIFNSSALVAALLARVGTATQNMQYLDYSKRAMNFLAARQRVDGSWTYGCSPRQQWVDGFHTGYNLSAIISYRRRTMDASFDQTMLRGFDFYKTKCFTPEGTPKYFWDQLYPIDIHACSQAMLTFCDFVDHNSEALDRAVKATMWTIQNMRSNDGSFFYQRHRTWTNRTPYMRWGQAWMFRALARVLSLPAKA